ncbi:MAG: hypothetical protein QME42_08425 [bacterium]|nr:hypothetical protein [bacterium]
MLLLSVIYFIHFGLLGCATLMVKPIENENKDAVKITHNLTMKERNNIKISVEYDSQFIEFTAFKVILKNEQSKPIYFQPLDCTIEVLDNEHKKVYYPCTERKVIKKDKWEMEHLPSYKEEKEIEIPASPDYYFGDVGLYCYEMDRIKSLLFEEGFISANEEKSGYIFFPYFKAGTKLKLKIHIQDTNFEFIYMVKSIRKSKIGRLFEEIFSYE